MCAQKQIFALREEKSAFYFQIIWLIDGRKYNKVMILNATDHTVKQARGVSKASIIYSSKFVIMIRNPGYYCPFN